MKFLCPACDRLSELTQFRLDAGALVIRCDRCGEEGRAVASALQPGAVPMPAMPLGPARVVPLRAVELPETATGGDPLAAPEGFCPKCVAPRSNDAQTCHACGLLFVNYVPEPVRPELVADWNRVLSGWSDPRAHDGFLAAAAAQGELAAAGRLYRIQLARRPGDPMAARGRAEVIRLAAASTMLAAPGASAATSQVKLGLVVLAALVVLACFVLIGRMAFGP